MADALILAETKVPALMVAHLVARRNHAHYAIPSDTDMQLVAGPVRRSSKRRVPCLEVWCPTFAFPERRDREVVDVALDLHCHDDTAQATEDGWLANIRRAFSGGPCADHENATDEPTNAFIAYLNGLSSGAKAGWAIEDFHATGGGNVVMEDQRVVRRTMVQCVFRSYVWTPRATS